MGSSSARLDKAVTILDDVATTASGSAIGAQDFKVCLLSFATDGGADAALTVKFQGSIQEAAPDFSAAQTVTNMWDYIEVVDLQNGNTVNGDTGVAVAGADDYRLFEMNINGMKWISATVTARAQGEITVKAYLLTNQ